MKRTVRLLSLLGAALLVLSACSTAEEAGTAVTEVGSPPAGAVTEEVVPSSEPAATTTSEAPATEAAGSTSGQSIVAIAQETPELSQLVSALQAAGLVDALEQAGPLTVFAPNNDAFAQLNQADLTALLADPAQLGTILQYHVVEGSYPSSELTDGQTLTTLSGDQLTVTIDGSTVMVGDAEVIQPDIQAGNGVIHVINQVLMP